MMATMMFGGGSVPQTIFQPQGGLGGAPSSPGGSSPIMFPGSYGGPPQAPVQNWQSAANPVQAYQQYENDYANYVNQNAAYQNALRAQPQSRGPQGFGVAGSGYGGMMPGGQLGGGSGGFDINAILQLLQRMGGGGGGGNFGSIFNGGGGGGWMNSISQMVSPQMMGGWSW